MKKIVLISLILSHFNYSYCQAGKSQLHLRVPIQLDRQKAEIPYSWGTQIQKSTAINFGIDALMSYNKKKLMLYSGVGFFINRFNIKRGYDHQALNPGRDSLPIGTETNNYVYSILRLPIGIEYQVTQNKEFTMGIGAEYLFNFSFRRKYNGSIPFAGANTIYKGFSNFGNSLNVFVSVAKASSNGTISLEPFIRIYNRYQKDRFFNEKESEGISRNFDAIGMRFKYSFTL